MALENSLPIYSFYFKMVKIDILYFIALMCWYSSIGEMVSSYEIILSHLITVFPLIFYPLFLLHLSSSLTLSRCFCAAINLVILLFYNYLLSLLQLSLTLKPNMSFTSSSTDQWSGFFYHVVNH